MADSDIVVVAAVMVIVGMRRRGAPIVRDAPIPDGTECPDRGGQLMLLVPYRASDTIGKPVHSSKEKGLDGPEFTRPCP
jgi:hypothetical protein